MKSKIAFPIANLVVLILTIWWNYYSNTGVINGETMGSLSYKYDTLFTPAGYAFSIWGLIYLSLIGNAIFWLRNSTSPGSKTQTLWVLLANLGNCLWVYLWLMEYTALSVLTMIFILVCLTKNALDLKIGQEKKSFWVWWPSSIYLGWITVALAANTSAFLEKIGWKGFLSADISAASLIIIATGIYFFLVHKRRLVYAAYVGVWAFVAIMLKQWDTNLLVQFTAMAAAIFLLIFAVIKDFKSRQLGVY